MTVRELIQKLMQVEDIDSDVTCYISGTLGELKDRMNYHYLTEVVSETRNV